MHPLLVIGAGGFGRETVEAVHAINSAEPHWDLLGFLDDDPVLTGAAVDGTPVVGTIEEIGRFPTAKVVVCPGHPGNYFSRKRIVRRLALPFDRYAVLVHPSAVLAATTEVGPGTVVLAAVVTTTGVHIGAHVAVMPGVVLTHDDVIADYCTLGAGVRLAGRVRIGEGAYVGSGAVVREDRTIGAWSLVGMGAVVTRNVPSGEVWVGVPARFLRSVEIPSDLQPAESGRSERR